MYPCRVSRCVAQALLLTTCLGQEHLEDESCLIGDCTLSLLQRRAAIRKPVKSEISSILQKDSPVLQSSPDPARLVPLPEAEGAFIIREAPEYVDLLMNVTTASGDNLYNATRNKSFVPNDLAGSAKKTWEEKYEHNFPNSALYAWGDPHAKQLYVFIPGTNAMCLMYGTALALAAYELGYFVVCPQLSYRPSAQESIMKPVCAAQYAFAIYGNFDLVVLGGHSGGAPAALASSAVLQSIGIRVEAAIMWHPGVVDNMNTPGCAKNCAKGCPDDNKVYCERYFPSDLLTLIESVKILVLVGGFCQNSKAQNSNYWSHWSCSGNAVGITSPTTSESCKNRTFPSPANRPAQPAVICPEGSCPNTNWLTNPGDCMISTAGISVAMLDFKNDFSGSVIFVNSCSEHVHSTSKYGWKEELQPYVLPFLKGLVASAEEAGEIFNNMRRHSEQPMTCSSWHDEGNMCIYTRTPYTYEYQSDYELPNGTVVNCNDSFLLQTSTTPEFWFWWQNTSSEPLFAANAR